MNIRKMPFLRLFMPKRKSRGALWTSLISLGVSAAVIGVAKGKGKNAALPFKNTVSNVKNMVPKLNIPKMNIESMDNAALAEYSEELMASALNKNKNNNNNNTKH